MNSCHCNEHSWVAVEMERRRELIFEPDELVLVCNDCPAWTSRELTEEHFVEYQSESNDQSDEI